MSRCVGRRMWRRWWVITGGIGGGGGVGAIQQAQLGLSIQVANAPAAAQGAAQGPPSWTMNLKCRQTSAASTLGSGGTNVAMSAAPTWAAGTTAARTGARKHRYRYAAKRKHGNPGSGNRSGNFRQRSRQPHVGSGNFFGTLNLANGNNGDVTLGGGNTGDFNFFGGAE